MECNIWYPKQYTDKRTYSGVNCKPFSLFHRSPPHVLSYAFTFVVATNSCSMTFSPLPMKHSEKHLDKTTSEQPFFYYGKKRLFSSLLSPTNDKQIQVSYNRHKARNESPYKNVYMFHYHTKT